MQQKTVYVDSTPPDRNTIRVSASAADDGVWVAWIGPTFGAIGAKGSTPGEAVLRLLAELELEGYQFDGTVR